MGNFGTWVAAHRKAIAGAVSAIGGILAFVASQQSLGKWAQYAGIGLAILGAAGVYRVPNATGSNEPATRLPPPPAHRTGS